MGAASFVVDCADLWRELLTVNSLKSAAAFQHQIKVVELRRHVLRGGGSDQGAGMTQAGVQVVAGLLFLSVGTHLQGLIKIVAHRLA